MAFQLCGPYSATSSFSFSSSDGLQWPLVHILDGSIDHGRINNHSLPAACYIYLISISIPPAPYVFFAQLPMVDDEIVAAAVERGIN